MEFRRSAAAGAAPPPGLIPPLHALWLDARGDWNAAHAQVQSDGGRAGAWVHAYLHRKEGDAANAGYWYTQAGRATPAEDFSLETEWEQIVRALLEAG